MLGRVRKWIDKYLGSLTADQVRTATGQEPLPFMKLPALLEVYPGRFVHQNSSTRADLKRAVIQSATKAANAGRYSDRVRLLAETAIPLMPDEVTTLADIAPRLKPLLDHAEKLAAAAEAEARGGAA